MIAMKFSLRSEVVDALACKLLDPACAQHSRHATVPQEEFLFCSHHDTASVTVPTRCASILVARALESCSGAHFNCAVCRIVADEACNAMTFDSHVAATEQPRVASRSLVDIRKACGRVALPDAFLLSR